jgi:predicted ester cyclase
MQLQSSFLPRRSRANFPVVLAVASAFAAVACGGAPPPPAASATPAAPPTPAPMTAEQSVDFYKKCWELFNTKAWDTFQNCYTPDATSDAVDSGQPPAKGRAAIIESAKATVAPNPDVRGDLQLLLANGRDLVTVALWKGTHTADMPGPGGKAIPATGKKFGFLMAHTIELDAGMTAAQADADYVEVGTLLGQLGISKAPVRKAIESGATATTVVIAKNDEAEAKNVAAIQARLEAFNKHDVGALAASITDKYALHEIALPADSDKKKSLASLIDLFKAFGDVKLTASKVYGAGDYVVEIGTFEGTNTGPMRDMGLKKGTGKHVAARYIEVFRLENGKIAEDWLFYNGLAFAGQLGLS